MSKVAPKSPSSPGASRQGPELARRLGLGALVVYGVGDMLGAGIYALIGKVAGVMGNLAWLAFLVSMIAALLTGMSYASLGSRYPRAAGAAYVTERAFQIPFLSYVLGLAVVASGLTSLAAQSHAFAGYLLALAGGPAALNWAVALAFLLVLTAVNFWGIRESMMLNFVCTLVEVSGLLFVVAVGVSHWGSVDYLEPPRTTGDGTASMVLQGAVLTFYAFIGFEDMINVTEEVRDPRRVFPIAVIAAMGMTALIYLAVSITAVSVLPYTRLAESTQPLVDVVTTASPNFPPVVFSLVALFAILNTGLLNYIMGSRMLYGMAEQGLVPRALNRVHASRRTPHVAILTLMVIVIGLSLSGTLAELASATSVLLLCVFVIVNAALIVLKHRPHEPRGRFEVPDVVPVLGIAACGLLLVHASARSLVIALMLMLPIAAMYLVMRPKAQR